VENALNEAVSKPTGEVYHSSAAVQRTLAELKLPQGFSELTKNRIGETRRISADLISQNLQKTLDRFSVGSVVIHGAQLAPD
jgi:hypothetical protein